MKKIEFLFFFYYKIEITWKIYFQLAVTAAHTENERQPIALSKSRHCAWSRAMGVGEATTTPLATSSIQQVEKSFQSGNQRGSGKTEPKSEQQTCYRFYMFNIWDTKPAIGAITITVWNNLICCASRSGKEFNEPRGTFIIFERILVDAMQVRIVKLCKMNRRL